MDDGAARLTDEQFATLLNAADDVVFLLDEDQRYVGIWGRWMELHGLDPGHFLGRTSWEIFGEESRAFFEPLNDRVLAGEPITYERWFDVPWGETIYYQTALTPMRDERGRVVGIVGVGRDITELKRTRDDLEHMALHDPLTDLPNRIAFRHAAERASARARRGAPACLMFIDIDNFKSCNDVGGHVFGDQMLSEIGRVLRERVREPDIVARIGGDEFGVVLESATIDDARTRGNEISDAVRELGLRHALDIDLSIGVVAVEDGLGFDEALAAADKAMYRAKESGDRIVVGGT